MSAGPRLVLYQLDVAATPTHDLGNQDMGPGFAHSSGITQYTHNMHTGSSVYCKHTNTHTLAQREAIMSYVTQVGAAGSEGNELTQKDPFCLWFWLNFKISLVLFRCLFFFYQTFCHCWIRRSYPSFSLPEFYTANFCHCLSLWVKQVL